MTQFIIDKRILNTYLLTDGLQSDVTS